MEHLKVTIHLHTPVLLGHPFIFFDGIVAHLCLAEELGEQYFSLPSNYPIQELVDRSSIPLKRVYCRESGDYFFAASISFFDDVKRTIKYSVTHFRKRFTEQYVHRVCTKKRKVRLGSGFYRLYDMKMLYVPCRKVVFYADGEKSEIERLLRKLPALGKKRHAGFGFVKKVDVEEIEESRSVVWDSVAMRPAPGWAVDAVETVKRFKRMELLPQAYKPPYWSKANVKMCTVPLQQYVFRKEVLRQVGL